MQNEAGTETTVIRFIAIDLHRHYLMVGGIDATQQIVLQPRKLDLERWLSWAQANLRPTDAVVIEATTNAWHIYDQLVPLVGKVVVADARQVKLIASARVKTDRHDVLVLAQLLRAELVPEVWVPPVSIRELRSLLAHRERLTRMRVMCLNRLRSILHRYNIKAPAGSIDAQKHREWWRQLELSLPERLRVEQDLGMVDTIDAQLKKLDAGLAEMSARKEWASELRYLLQVPGVGWLTGLTVLAAIGDIERFESAQKLVGYAGLGAGVHASGTRHQTGRITKEGRRELRWVLIEAAQTAVRRHPHWKRQFERLEARIGRQKAIVAIARKLLVAIWHVWHKRTVDVHGDEDYIGIKLWSWGRALSEAQRGGLSVTQWTRLQLLWLGIGHHKTHIVRGLTRRRLPSVEEVVALCPGLAEELAAAPG
jgi:transposase